MRTHPSAPPSALSILGVAARRVLGRPRLVLLLWLLSLVPAFLAAIPGGLALHAILSRRPALLDLARGQGDALWAEILTDHPTLAPALIGSLLIAALLSWLTGAILSGGLLRALHRPGHPRRAVGAEVLRRAVDHAREMIAVSLWGGLLMRAPVLILGGLALFALSKWARERPFTPVLALGCALLVLLGLLWSLASLVIENGRLASLGERAPRRRLDGLRALRAGLRRVLGRPGLAQLLAGFSVLSALLLFGAGRLLAQWLDYQMLVGLAFLSRQVFAVLRAACALTVMAGVVEAVDSQQDEARNVSDAINMSEI